MIGIGEVRVVQKIEELAPQLQTEALSYLEILDDRKVQIEKTWAVHHIAPHVAKSARNGRSDGRCPLGVAPKLRQLIDGGLSAGGGNTLGIASDDVPVHVSREGAGVKKRNRGVFRPVNIGGISGDIPMVIEFAGTADVVKAVVEENRRSALSGEDAVDMPALEQLRETRP